LKYRSRTDIVAQILEVALEGVTKTRIMYGAYLSYQQLNEYSGVLIQNGLLEHIPEEKTFVTTQKGREFLESYEHLNGLSGKMTSAAVERW
jgi:predicted transcriptional regulator